MVIEANGNNQSIMWQALKIEIMAKINGVIISNERNENRAISRNNMAKWNEISG
jgi:hypothetical protein